MRARPGLRALPACLREDRSGVAYTEFALCLPVLLVLGLMGVETAHFALAVQKCSEIAMITADNASRVRISIDETDINDIMTGAKLAGKGIDFAANGRIILSDLEPNGLTGSNKGQYIRWQRCSGAKNATSSYGSTGDGKTDGSFQNMGPAGNKVAAMDGAAVMFAEVQYTYQPIVGNYWAAGSRTISYTSAFVVRQRTDQSLHNDNNPALTNSQISNCSNYSA